MLHISLLIFFLFAVQKSQVHFYSDFPLFFFFFQNEQEWQRISVWWQFWVNFPFDIENKKARLSKLENNFFSGPHWYMIIKSFEIFILFKWALMLLFVDCLLKYGNRIKCQHFVYKKQNNLSPKAVKVNFQEFSFISSLPFVENYFHF